MILEELIISGIISVSFAVILLSLFVIIATIIVHTRLAISLRPRAACLSGLDVSCPQNPDVQVASRE